MTGGWIRTVAEMTRWRVARFPPCLRRDAAGSPSRGLNGYDSITNTSVPTGLNTMTTVMTDMLSKQLTWVEKIVETTLFKSRWLLAPLYIGLMLCLVMLMIKFIQEFLHIVPHILEISGLDLILQILALVDVVLVANLLLMIIFSGYENFVSKIDMVEGHVDRPEWMGKIDYSGLKLKVIGSVVAISYIELLRAFMRVNDLSDRVLYWLVGIHMAFIVSGVLFALMDKLGHRAVPHAEHDE